MMEQRECFLMDANVFIEPYRRFYAFDIVPSYWKELEKQINSETKKVFILDRAKDEIMKPSQKVPKDDLAKWVNGKHFPVYATGTEEIIRNYARVQNYVSSCGLYNQAGIKSWAGNQADPWLIAASMATDYAVVTMEVAVTNRNVKVQSKAVKIPDVADHFGVKAINLFDMMRLLGMQV
jgi:hypothetical protein